MPWTNGTITVYHGTDNLSANAIRQSELDPNRFNSQTDFGAGFYVTTSLHQAQQWANQRCRPTTHLNPEVLEYHLLRDVIESSQPPDIHHGHHRLPRICGILPSRPDQSWPAPQIHAL